MILVIKATEAQLLRGFSFPGCRVAGAGGAQAAKDAAGNDVRASSWLQTHKPSERSPHLAAISWCLGFVRQWAGRCSEENRPITDRLAALLN